MLFPGLQFCHGVLVSFLLLKLRQNVVNRFVEATEHTGLLTDSQEGYIQLSVSESKPYNAVVNSIESRPFTTTESWRDGIKQRVPRYSGFFFAMFLVSTAYILNSAADYVT